MTALNTQPSSFYFDRNIGYSDPYRRCTERKTGNVFSGGLGAFAGVEYFFAPLISIGGELGLGFVYSAAGQPERTLEYWDASAGQLQTVTERKSGWRTEWTAQTAGLLTNTYGSIFLMFHF
jgi:hypothetical protein